jgi:hypothetical protein
MRLIEDSFDHRPHAHAVAYHHSEVFVDSERNSVRSVDRLVSELARSMIVAEPGSRLRTVRELATIHGSSLASIHAAMTRLIDAGAIEVDTRGRRGAFLVDRSMSTLWNLAESSPLVLALPLASSRRYEALATAIKQELRSLRLEVFLTFMRGSRKRLDALHAHQCHLVVMSAFAAHELSGETDEVVLELPANTFNTGHRVFYSPLSEGKVPLRVIVDRDSADQQLLTALEFGSDGIEPVIATSVQFPLLLETGQGDAAVWTLDEMQMRWPQGIVDRPLVSGVRERVHDSDTRAALVARKADADVLRALLNVLDPARIEAIEADVLAGRRVPEY